jgi:hypothetical protein
MVDSGKNDALVVGRKPTRARKAACQGMTGIAFLLVDGFKILVVRLRQIGRGAGQSKWVYGNGRSFANGRFNPPSGDYKSDCDYRESDAEQGTHVRSPLGFAEESYRSQISLTLVSIVRSRCAVHHKTTFRLCRASQKERFLRH